MKYLFRDWDKIKKDLYKRNIFLFLDFDGTLAPIVSVPEKAKLPNDTKKILKDLVKTLKCKVAIISGRALKDIKNKVRLKNIIYVGVHGFQIEGQNLKNFIPKGFFRTLEIIRDELKKKIHLFEGVILEDKDVSLALHYRLVKKEKVTHLKDIFKNIISSYLINKKIKLKTGRKVLEILPFLSWDKGKVVKLLLKKEISLNNKEVFPIYMGDDKTDEDAFRVLKRKGLAVSIGRIKNSFAEYYLKNPSEVKEFLKKLLLLCKN
jgi:trehalose-phosphatase